MASFLNRMIRAAKLDLMLYEEVEADKNATGQAMLVVILSSVAAGMGSINPTGGGIARFFFGTLAALFGWLIWSYLTYFIGTKLLPEPQTRSNYGELLRTIGFSSSPGIFRIFGVIPILKNIISFIVGIWMLVAMVIAVRQALDYRSTGRAVGVCIVGWIVQVAMFTVCYYLAAGDRF